MPNRNERQQRKLSRRSSSGTNPSHVPGLPGVPEELPRFTRPLRPLVDWVAGIKTGVHRKLFLGFLGSALLLVVLAVVSIAFMQIMHEQEHEKNNQREIEDRARQMLYLVTAQSHFRTMALLTNDASWNDKITKAKADFEIHLNFLEEQPNSFGDRQFRQELRAFNQQYAAASETADRLYREGNLAEALRVHLDGEHPSSHKVEDAMRRLIETSASRIDEADEQFHLAHTLLALLVLFFAGLSVALAMLLGFVFSWSFIRPVRRINYALASVAAGDFTQRVTVPNRDEFGTLARNLNETTQQLATLYGQLQAELAERRKAEQALEHRAAELAAVNKELDAFCSSVSHDLRAPLRSMDGFSQALLEDYADKLDEQGKNYLQRVRSNSQRMGELIDDLLSLSRVTRGEMRREWVDLSGLAKAIAEDLRQRQPERQVTFVIADGLEGSGDPHLLRIALENLLGNAWKYTRKHSQARIEFGMKTSGGETIYFVKDDGTGFDMAYADRLFGAFQRLHPASEFEGTGVGLATVQRIINRHGGHVSAEGVVEQGATFYFTL